MKDYPPVGFHFSVRFGSLKENAADSGFQEVSGLTVTLETEEFAEGGENRFKHKLPKRTTYGQLELKRGMHVDSAFIDWCHETLESFVFKPQSISIQLLDEEHTCIRNWNVEGAYPVEWSVSGFNAKENGIVIESVKLFYTHFKVDHHIEDSSNTHIPDTESSMQA